jgi:hypothetical protein
VERGNGEGVVRKTEHSGDSVAFETAYYNGYSKVGPRRTKSWDAVPPANIDTTYVEAKNYIGIDTTTDTNFIHRYHKKLVAPDGYAVITAEAWRPFADTTNLVSGGGGIVETDTATTRFTRYVNKYTTEIRSRQRITYVQHNKYFAIRTFAASWLREDGAAGDTWKSFNKKLLQGSRIKPMREGYDAIKIRFDTWTTAEFVDGAQPLP